MRTRLKRQANPEIIQSVGPTTTFVTVSLEKDTGKRTMVTSSSFLIFVVSVATKPQPRRSISVAWSTQANSPSHSSCERETSLCVLTHDNVTPPLPCEFGADIETLRSTERVTVYINRTFIS